MGRPRLRGTSGSTSFRVLDEELSEYQIRQRPNASTPASSCDHCDTTKGTGCNANPHEESWNCTNPNPRGSPVILLRMRMTSFKVPHFPKCVLSISSVVCHVRPPKKILPSTSASGDSCSQLPGAHDSKPHKNKLGQISIDLKIKDFHSSWFCWTAQHR